jgi:hypothetical protein
VLINQLSIAKYARFLLLAMSVLGLFSVVASAQTGGGTAINAICQVFNTIRNIIFLLGLTLMILGGALYAGANLMPAQSKGGFQGYGMARL